MSKQITIGNQSYDSRSVVTSPEKLKLPNHPKVNAMAMPNRDNTNLTIILNVPFGATYTHTERFTSTSPKRIDAIRKVEYHLKQLPMYQRITK